MNEGHPEFLRLLEVMKELHLKKRSDYGSDSDPLENLRSSAEIGIPPWLGGWLRAKDKVKRINQFCLKGSLVNESMEDSLLDLAAYCLLVLCLRKEEQTGTKPGWGPSHQPHLERRHPTFEEGLLIDNFLKKGKTNESGQGQGSPAS